MRDSDVLDNNPHVSRSALEAMHGQVFGWALSRCNYEQVVAEDLVQQAYMELLTGRAQFDGKASLKTFVFAVVQNLARNRFRRRARHLQLAQQAMPDETVATMTEPGSDDAVWQAVQKLPPRQRDIVELVFCRDLTIEEASKVMGVSTGTGRVHYDRAKRALRERLSDERPRT
jgi:RNA polymerase sigma-70 factor (ECF subfamily)